MEAEKTEKILDAANGEMTKALGRRKRATARVRLTLKKDGAFAVNGKSIEVYFPTPILRETVRKPIEVVGKENDFEISVRVVGGGKQGQAGAVRHAIARALLLWNPDWRKSLKTLGLLRRDPREKERKKFGLKKARRAPQWSKR